MNKGAKGGEEDMGEASMVCSKHPHKNNNNNNNNPGGICAFCLQEKLGKLVSSSFPNAIFPSSSSSSPSFRSDSTNNAIPFATSSTSLSLSSAHNPHSLSSYPNNIHPKDSHYKYQTHPPRRARIPFLLTQKKKKKSELDILSSNTTLNQPSNNSIILKRSKSTTTPRRGHSFLDMDDNYNSQRRRFWSFIYHSKTTSSVKRTTPASNNTNTVTSTPSATSFSRRTVKGKEFAEDHDSPASESNASTTSFERKVSRSRSVGCGSRSFSGDFFERISTGFGDCTLRRVESQREGKPKIGSGMKEKARCGGIFGGFIMTSSSSSSSSSSYWTAAADERKTTPGRVNGHVSHGRSRSWGWAFASPLRAFSKPKEGKSNKNATTTPNLAAIPSLLAV